jgi:trk system potassium uptake protein TrkA
MHLVIIGGGQRGTELAEEALAAGHQVAIVEKDEPTVEHLRERLPDARIVHGDGDEPVVLEEAGVPAADAVAAMTDEDEDNLVACLLGRREYGVAATLARINNPRNEWLFSARFGVDVAVPEDDLDPGPLVTRMAAAVAG